MRPAHYIVVTVMIVSALALSLLMIPGETEMALIHLKDKEFESARATYEARVAAGDYSHQIVVPLSQLYLQYGEIDRAIELMREFLRRNPGNVSALSELAQYFHFAQRPEDRARTLEVLVQARPEETLLRDLSAHYNYTGDYPKQIAAIRRLLAQQQATARDYLDLAYLEASQGEVREAAQTMQRFERTFPESIDEETVEFLLSLLLDADKPQEAARRATLYLAGEERLDQAAGISALFHYKRQPGIALELLHPYRDRLAASPVLLRQYLSLEIANGLTGAAYARASELHRTGRLPVDAAEPFIDLLFRRNEFDTAMKVAEAHGWTNFPDWIIAALVRYNFDNGRLPVAHWIVRETGEDTLATDPVLASALADLRGDEASFNRWSARAANDAALQPFHRIQLSTLLLNRSRKEEAIRLIEGLHPNQNVPESDWSAIGGLVLLAGEPARGAACREARRRPDGYGAREFEWARLAVASSTDDRVAHWLREVPAAGVSTQRLMDLFYAAREHGRHQVALDAARALHRIRGDHSDGLRLLDALVSNDRAAEGLSLARDLVRSSSGNALRDAEGYYLAALTDARRLGQNVEDELRTYWSGRLEATGLPEAEVDAITWALLDLHAFDRVLPTLERLARNRPDEWLGTFADTALRADRRDVLTGFLKRELDRADLPVAAKANHLRLLIEHDGSRDALQHLRSFADTGSDEWIAVYESALREAGLTADLVEFWRTRANRPELPAAERRNLGFKALEAGQKRLAENIFASLAQGPDPAGTDLAQLLFLWGPRPPERGIAWIEGRLAASGAADRSRWLEVLEQAGAYRRVIHWLSENPHWVDDDPSLLVVHARARVAMNDRPGLKDALVGFLSRNGNPDSAMRVARVALENGLSQMATEAYRQVLRHRPDDSEAMLRLGVQAFLDGDYSAVPGLLGPLVQQADRHPETHFYFGEWVRREHGLRAARPHYQRVLSLADGGRPGVGDQILRALAWARLGSVDQAAALFEGLIAASPEDQHLRADYVSLLLENRRLDAAQRILAAVRP